MNWRRQYVYVSCWGLYVITCVKSLVLGLPCGRCWIYSFFTIQALWGFNSIVQWKYDTRGWVNMSQAGVLNILVRRKDHFTTILEIGVCHWQHVTCIYSFLSTISNSDVFKLMPFKIYVYLRAFQTSHQTQLVYCQAGRPKFQVKVFLSRIQHNCKAADHINSWRHWANGMLSGMIMWEEKNSSSKHSRPFNLKEHILKTT